MSRGKVGRGQQEEQASHRAPYRSASRPYNKTPDKATCQVKKIFIWIHNLRDLSPGVSGPICWAHGENIGSGGNACQGGHSQLETEV